MVASDDSCIGRNIARVALQVAVFWGRIFILDVKKSLEKEENESEKMELNR